ncbi:hypothetical protein [Nonomuraea jiangxiensis]|uniref:Lipoprotein n=1 Tax=Nonomuraea jiangxiensis TaxID=633440 RepID=A0A1G8QN43_9ACTN|nr:hypothetical protein [Nonomuraea jiangxiensis]SDJ06202.1 hypothetical protein SAMN05421869_108305 [Nonomuraea jiangxiensis]
MARALALSVLLLACLTSGGCTADTTPQGIDRRALIWVNALAVARPDYQVVHEEQLLSRAYREHRDTVRVAVEPRWPGWSHSEVFGRQNLELRLTPDGHVSMPVLRHWRLTDAIQVPFSSAETQAQTTEEAVARLEELARVEDLKVTVVVGFKKPLQESEVRQVWKMIPDVGLFSPPVNSGGLPISWDYSGYCNARGLDDCNPDIRDSLTSVFRSWTDELTTEDGAALASFGLNLPELRTRAAQGLWYGMIGTTWPDHVTTIVKDPRVSVVEIAQVAF